MKRKLGPLQLWQWILIGAAVGVGTVLYRRGHPAGAAAQGAAAAALPSDAQFNPIDPTTGLPVSGGVATSPVTTHDGNDDVSESPTPTTPAAGFGDLLDNFTMLEGLLAGLQDLQHPPGAATETDPAAVQEQVGTKRAAKKKAKPTKPKAKKTTHPGHANPGHQVVHHGGGRKTPKSSAPHNAHQHHHVQPPAHQRHDPTKHHSAQHPAARTPGHPQTPAAHPPAKREHAAKRAAGRPSTSPTHVATPVSPHHPAPTHHPAPRRKPRRKR